MNPDRITQIANPWHQKTKKQNKYSRERVKKDGVSMSGWSRRFHVDRGSIRVRKYEV